MTKEKQQLIADKFKNGITEEQSESLLENIENISDEKYDGLCSVRMKSLRVTVILSAVLGLFGAGNFYLGNIGRGLIKVIFNIVLPLILGFVFLYWLSPLHKQYNSEADYVSAAVLVNSDYGYSLENLSQINTLSTASYEDLCDRLSSLGEQKEALNVHYGFLTDNRFKKQLTEATALYKDTAESLPLQSARQSADGLKREIEATGAVELITYLRDLGGYLIEADAIKAKADTVALSDGETQEYTFSSLSAELIKKLTILTDTQKIREASAAIDGLTGSVEILTDVNLNKTIAEILQELENKLNSSDYTSAQIVEEIERNLQNLTDAQVTGVAAVRLSALIGKLSALTQTRSLDGISAAIRDISADKIQTLGEELHDLATDISFLRLSNLEDVYKNMTAMTSVAAGAYFMSKLNVLGINEENAGSESEDVAIPELLAILPDIADISDLIAVLQTTASSQDVNNLSADIAAWLNGNFVAEDLKTEITGALSGLSEDGSAVKLSTIVGGLSDEDGEIAALAASLKTVAGATPAQLAEIKTAVAELENKLEAQTFTDINEALDDFNAVLTLKSAVAGISGASGLSDLCKKIQSLLDAKQTVEITAKLIDVNTKINSLPLVSQTTQTVDSVIASVTGAKTEIEDLGKALENKVNDLKAKKVGEEKLGDFIDNLATQLSEASRVVDKVSEDFISLKKADLIDKLVAERQRFADFDGFFVYVSEQINGRICNSVDNKLHVNITMENVNGSFAQLKEEDNVDEIKRAMDGVCNSLGLLRENADKASSDWKFSYRYQNMLISGFLIAYGTVAVAWWIGEIFRNKEKCCKLNYEKALKIIN